MESESRGQKPTETEGRNRTPNQHAGGPAPQIPPAPRPAEVNPPETPPCETKTCKKHRDWHDITMLVIQGIGVFFLIAYTSFAALQWCEMRKSVQKMDEGISAANRSATAAETANSNATADARPWIGPVNFSPGKYEPGDTVQGIVVFINAGRRPAHIMHSRIASNWYKAFPVNPSYEGAPPGLQESHPVLVPNSVYETFLSKPTTISREEIEARTRAGQTFYVYAAIDYLDSEMKKLHHTTFCDMYVPAQKVFASCSTYNDAD